MIAPGSRFFDATEASDSTSANKSAGRQIKSGDPHQKTVRAMWRCDEANKTDGPAKSHRQCRR